MVVKGCLNWPQSCILHASPQTLASTISTPSPKRGSFNDLTLICPMFGNNLTRSRSCGSLNFSTPKRPIRRIVSANFDSYLSDDERVSSSELKNTDQFASTSANWSGNDFESRNLDQFAGYPANLSRYEDMGMIMGSIERKANKVELPFSLRMIQKKKRLEEGIMEASESAYCSMKKAFSSMVFIIRELQSYTLQMREILYLEDLQVILVRVQKEMNASFVWLFQQVFSHTPTLMVYVMILLANYSVYSIANHVTIATSMPTLVVESISMTEEDQTNSDFDSSIVKTFFVNTDGINGGGGKYRPLVSGTDGDGKFDEYIEHQTIVPNRIGEESISGQDEEWGLWKSMLAEADEMRGVMGDGDLDHETMGQFVSPVMVKMEEVDTEDYLKTELVYQRGLLTEPDNPLLLANYAQFLYLFAHDHKRAEVYFKKASEIEPKDAETLSKYASFLWHAKNDLWAAEETFLEAISADPTNSFYTASYAHFLWSNGADDTCFPLESPESVNSDEF
nr:hypothetical protein [Tanacetum cinerariifolium]